MIDLDKTIIAKTDQLTADDLLSGPRTIRITKVKGNEADDQPVSIFFEGDGGKPFKPCKTVRRVLRWIWGRDASQFVGHSLTLYRDEEVSFGGLKVGGIRVSHASHIDNEMVVPVQAKKGRKAPVRVKPLKAEPVPLKVVEKPAATDGFDIAEFEATVNLALTNFDDAETLATWWEEQKPYRLQARDADKARAGQIATRVNEQIEKLKGDC